MLWPGTHQNMSYHKAALMLHTLERMLHVGSDAARAVDLLLAMEVQASDGPRISSRCSNEVTGKDHKWFIDQVYRSSNTFDYAIERLSSEPIGARGLMESARRA